MNIRELILDMLMEIEDERTYSNILIRNVLDKYDYLSLQEKAFIKRVTEGTLERRIQIDYIIDLYSKIPVRKMKPFIRSLLRMSVYQILFMDSVPDPAVCNEAVKLAGKRRFQSLKGFVNGVLRTVARQKTAIPYPDQNSDPVRYLSVMYSMPEQLIRMWAKDYGMEVTETILKEMLKIHPVTIRLKESIEDEEKESLLKKIKAAGIGIEEHPYLPYAYDLTHLEGVRTIPGFEEGAFAVQDVSSMICVECADIREGDFVVDVCAAPGGKSTHAAEKLKGTGKVLSRDISLDKTLLIEENVNRQRFENIEVQVFDVAVCDENLVEKADVVMADLPCSGLGILGKKRDIKYNVTEDMLKELPVLQKKILDTVWRYVKPGGVLIYSTCTIHKEENEEIVRWFIQNYPFAAEDLSEILSGIPHVETAKEGYVQLLPGIHAADGFFVARFRKGLVK